MVVVGEWGKLQVAGHQGVRHGSAVPNHVDDLGAGEGGGQVARLGQLEWFLAADDVSGLSMSGDHLEDEC